jgi:hypothetical protein
MKQLKEFHMIRKVLGVSASVLAVMVVVGVAWASGTDDPSPSSSTVAVADSSTTVDGSSSSTTLGGQTTTSFGDGTSTSTAPGSSTTTLGDGGSTSTTLANGPSTSTTIDDDDNEDEDHDEDNQDEDNDENEDEGTEVEVALVDGTHHFEVGSAGTVSFQILGGRLILLDVAVNTGWNFEVEENSSDEIEISFDNGDGSNEFEAKVHNGVVEVEIELGS